jgi:hypothetical protein
MITDTKLVAQTVIPKEVGNGVPAVTCWRGHILMATQVKNEITCGTVCFLWSRPVTYLGSGLRDKLDQKEP